MYPSPTSLPSKPFSLRRFSALLVLCAAFSPLLLATHAMGAVIMWDSSPSTVAVNDESQVSTEGTLFTAATFWTSAVTINASLPNEVIFQPFATAPHFTPFTPVDGSGGGGYVPTNEYGKLIARGAFLTADAPTGGYNHPAVISGLTVDQEYLIQIWVPVWGSGDWPTQFSFFSDGTRNSSTNNSPTLHMSTNTTLTNYIIGTFTATSSTEDLYLFAQTPGGFSYAGISSFQIRAVPEPTTVALFALGGLALAVRGRFRLRRLIA